SLAAECLASGPGHVRYAHDVITPRRLPLNANQAATANMNRLYVVEPAVTCTGAKADHRLAVRGSEIESIARGIAAELGIGAKALADPEDQRWIAAVAEDLSHHRGRSLVLAGRRQPPI